MKRKHHAGQVRIGGIVGAEPEPIERTPERDFQVGDRVRYRRSGGVGSMDFLAVVDGLIIRLTATKREIQLRPDQCNLAFFRTGDEVMYREGRIEWPPVLKEPNAKVAGLVLKLPSGADLTIMPIHHHYEGLTHAYADAQAALAARLTRKS